MDKNVLISRDRMRYSKNKFSANLALLSIVFNAIYFASIYRGVEADIDKYYFTIMIGVSVLVNLVFMLATFLASEGVKNYKFAFTIVMLVMAGLQVLRIFYYPINAHAAAHTKDPSKLIMETPQFILCIIMLIASATCLVVGAVVGMIRIQRLNSHNKFVEQSGGKLSFEDENNVPIVEATTNTNLDASVMGEEPIKSETPES